MWDKILNLIALIIVAKVGAVVITRFIKSYDSTNLHNRLNIGMVSRKDLSQVSDSRFINWCLNILQLMNFTSVDLVSASLNNDIQICAYNKQKKIYVKCIKCEHISTSKDPDDFQKIEKSEFQKLLGIMEHDGVDNALVLTNGDFSSEALEYVKTLPSNFNISLIDGCNLTRCHRIYQNQYATT